MKHGWNLLGALGLAAMFGLAGCGEAYDQSWKALQVNQDMLSVDIVRYSKMGNGKVKFEISVRNDTENPICMRPNGGWLHLTRENDSAILFREQDHRVPDTLDEGKRVLLSGETLKGSADINANDYAYFSFQNGLFGGRHKEPTSIVAQASFLVFPCFLKNHNDASNRGMLLLVRSATSMPFMF